MEETGALAIAAVEPVEGFFLAYGLLTKARLAALSDAGRFRIVVSPLRRGRDFLAGIEGSSSLSFWGASFSFLIEESRSVFRNID